jgi:hypothetical protein
MVAIENGLVRSSFRNSYFVSFRKMGPSAGKERDERGAGYSTEAVDMTVSL